MFLIISTVTGMGLWGAVSSVAEIATIYAVMVSHLTTSFNHHGGLSFSKKTYFVADHG